MRKPGSCPQCGSTKAVAWRKDSSGSCLVGLACIALAPFTFGLSLLGLLFYFSLTKKGKRCADCGHNWELAA